MPESSPKTMLHQSSSSNNKLNHGYRSQPQSGDKRRRKRHGRTTQDRSSRIQKQPSSNSIASSMSTDHRSNTAVYVKDAVYVWLPAQIMSSTEEKAVVKIVIPDDWASTTIFEKYSSITELEYQTTSAGFGNYSSPRFGQSENENTAPRKKKYYSYERAHLEFDESIPRGVQRTCLLRDYPNSEMPLQNTDRHAERRLSTSRRVQRNTIYHPLVNARDMADLHYLHEAAILYNLKQRHGQNLPYTRVGDIVVAVNPFVWIEGLYSAEKQALYAKHLIWDAKDYEVQKDVIELHEEDVSDLGNISDMGEGDLDSIGGMGTGKNIPMTPSGKMISFRTLNSAANSDESSTKSKKNEPMAHGSIYSKLGLEPHVYETASLAYRGLSSDRKNQTILVSGESGAGKTETVKIVMSNLATVEQTRPFYEQPNEGFNRETVNSVVNQVLESNPVFEAFGCAKTVRNDNSSRFGRFTQLQYEVESRREAERNSRQTLPNCLLQGSFCATYLLEKSRVVGHAPGERTYHIFYQLLSAPENEKRHIWDGLRDTNYESFVYIGESTTNSIEGKSDSESWQITVKALQLFGFSDDSFRQLLRALCVVLQLGNLTFAPSLSSEEGSEISSTVELDKLSQLMGIPKQNIEKAMTVRVNKIRGEEVTSRPNPKDAKEGCDALAKSIYACIFDKLVKQINERTSVGSEAGNSVSNGSIGTISLLDIFGFERFDVNRFEQLCINFSNERLQHRYVLDNFRAVKEEYTAEGIEIFDFGMVDNSGVIELLEGKLGLITSLNEECVRPQGKASSFVYKLKMLHNDSKYLLMDKLQDSCEFGIKHFAGAVTYDASQFLKSNADLTPKDLLHCAYESSNPLIREEFESLISSKDTKGPPRRAGARTVMAKFRSQLNVLMGCIQETKTRYIRCIKPNAEMIPKKLHHRETMKQLESAGLVTAIVISRETFPNRLPYDVIWERFRCLQIGGTLYSSGDKLNEGDLKDNVQKLLASLLLKPFTRADGARVPTFSCGRTKVYFRTGALEQLESDRMEYYSYFASRIGVWYRCKSARLKFRRLKVITIVVQAQARMRLQRQKFRAIRKAAILIQSLVRMVSARRSYVQARSFVTNIQGAWRRFLAKRSFRASIQSIILLQSKFRQVIAKRRYFIVLQSTLAIQSFWKGCIDRRIVNSIRIEHSCAIRIQVWYRVLKARRNMKLAAKRSISRGVDNDGEIFNIDGQYSEVAMKSKSLANLELCSIEGAPSDSSSCDECLTGRKFVDVSKDDELKVVKEELSALRKLNTNLTIEAESHEKDQEQLRLKVGSLQNELKRVEAIVKSLGKENLDLKGENSSNVAALEKMRNEELIMQGRFAVLEELKANGDAEVQKLKHSIESAEEDRIAQLDLNNSLKTLVSSMQEDLGQRNDELTELRRLASDLQDENSKKDNAMNIVNNRIISLEAENEDMDIKLTNAYGEVNSLQLRLNSLEEEANEMNSELEICYGQVNMLKSHTNALKKDANEMNQQLELMKNENESLKAEGLLLLKNNEESEEKSKILQGRIISLNEDKADITRMLNASESNVRALTEDLVRREHELSGAMKQAENLQDTVATKDEEIKSLRDQISSLQEKVAIRDSQLDSLHSELASLKIIQEDRARDFLEVQNQLDLHRKTITTRESELLKLEHKIGVLNEDGDSMKTRLLSLENNIESLKKDLTNSEKVTASKEEEIASLQQKISSFENDIKGHTTTANDHRNRIVSLEQENAEISTKLTRQLPELTSLRQILTVKEEELKSLKDSVDAEVKRGRDEMRSLKQTIATLTEEKNSAEDKKRELLSQISSLELAISSQKDECDHLRSKVQSIQEEKENMTSIISKSDKGVLDWKEKARSLKDLLEVKETELIITTNKVLELETDLTDRHGEIKNQKNLLASAEKEKEVIKSQSEVQVKMLKGQVIDLKQELLAGNDKVTKFETQVENIENRLKIAARESADAKAEKDASAKEIILLNDLVRTLKQTITTHESKAKDLANDFIEEVSCLKEENENLRLTHSLLESELSRAQNNIEDAGHFKKRLTSVQEENSTLKGKVDTLESSKTELMNHMQSLVIASKSATNRSQSLLQTNKTLLSEISKLKLESAQLRRAYKSSPFEQNEKNLPSLAKYERMLNDRDSEIMELKEALADSIRGREMFAQNAEKKMGRERDAMLSEIHSLKVKLQKSQDTSDDYKQKIIDVLQTSHSTREAEVRKLRKEIKRLNEKQLKPGATTESTLSTLTRKHRIEQAKGSFKMHHDHRRQRVMGITDLVQTLKLGTDRRDMTKQDRLLDQIINSLEEFCESEGQQSNQILSALDEI